MLIYQACVTVKGHEGVPDLNCCLSHCVELSLPLDRQYTGKDGTTPYLGNTVDLTMKARNMGARLRTVGSATHLS